MSSWMRRMFSMGTSSIRAFGVRHRHPPIGNDHERIARLCPDLDLLVGSENPERGMLFHRHYS